MCLLVCLRSRMKLSFLVTAVCLAFGRSTPGPASQSDKVQDNHHETHTDRDENIPKDGNKWHIPSHLHPDTLLDTHPYMDGPDGGEEESHTHSIGGGLMQCGEYRGEETTNGLCRLTATLPQHQQRCPEMFRCTDEVSYWLHENQERKGELGDLKDTVSQLQEELRNHRHRIRVLELQTRDRSSMNSSLEERFRVMGLQLADTDTLLHDHGSLLYELQTHLGNLTMTVERIKRNSGCMINIVRTAKLLSTQEALHPEVQHVRDCPIDCASLYYNGVHRSGVYTVVPALSSVPVEVYCDMETEGGGWTVFQRRQDGRVNFNRGWQDYRDGFGELRTEHWLGNEYIHKISTQGDYSLRIDLEDWTHKHKHALYQSFSIEDEQNQYRLHVSGFSGTVEDSFGWYHDKQGFSTPDTGNICAEISHAGWWYHQCFYANLNGVYYKGGRYSSKSRTLLGPDGVVWYTWKDSDYYSMKKVVMMIRPRTFSPRLSP